MTFISRRTRRQALAATLIALALTLAGAVWAGTTSVDRPHPLSITASPAPTSPLTGPSGTSSSPRTKHPSPRPTDKPSDPRYTTRAPNGTLVNTCVPKALHSRTLSLRTSDGIRLSALVLGSGPNGIVLAHEHGYTICSWLDLAQTLADRGYHVIVFDHRNHGASGIDKSEENTYIDRDILAAGQELTRRGVTRILAGGASCGGTGTVVAAPRIPGFIGLVVMASPRVCGKINALKVITSVTRPSLFAVSPGDYGDAMEREVRGLHKASGAKDKRLVIVDGGSHGTDMLRSREGPALEAKLLAFIADAFRVAG
ncbi:alpha/beta fold hydrolase [Micromonospora sp. URMC 105]|uniref:alpha/beta hydrolase n=1 Tax=Micromonospora sp. URMC 105 TaxID=3423413 RepID=UPI003F1DF489